MSENLKPCPFCGKDKASKQDCGCLIQCEWCKAELHRSDPEDAIAAWNTRAEDWRPIDYAALKLGDEMEVTNGKYMVGARWESVDYNEMSDQDCRDFVAIGGHFEFTDRPTHFRPLPAPPREGE